MPYRQTTPGGTKAEIAKFVLIIVSPMTGWLVAGALSRLISRLVMRGAVTVISSSMVIWLVPADRRAPEAPAGCEQH
jgi:hypothetical protein